jgi:hypothetical protein
MPAFTFEKISSPLRRAQNALTEKKEQPRSVMVKILDRFGRSRRDKPAANEQAASAKQTPKP